MNIELATPGTRVAYVPLHASGCLDHFDVEYGTVSSHNGKNVFVKFNEAVSRFGWDGATSRACDPADLVKV
jgi:hypothetical protein